MKKAGWKKRLIESCKAAGTYRDYFLPVIETLATILEKRDEAQALFDSSGGEIIVEHTNKGGATNLEQNPMIRLINDLNRDALAYWRDLGLTPAGLKRIDEKKLTQKPRKNLEDILSDIGL